MKLSTRGDHAVRVLLELASREDGEPVPLTELAERTQISAKYLEQILMLLRSSRILDARRGPSGGYMLARPATNLTVGEVIRAVEGPLAPTLCASRTLHEPCPAYRCPDEGSCVMRDLWLEVRDAISAIVDNTTFQDLAERNRQRRPARPTYQI